MTDIWLPDSPPVRPSPTTVLTRQVLRRKEFEYAFHFTTGQFPGEPRVRRRRIARNRVRLEREQRKIESIPLEQVNV